MPALVSLAHCSELTFSAVSDAVDQAVEPLGGMAAFVRPGQRVLVKPNLIAADPPERAATTHPLVVQRVVELVQAAGGEPFIGDSPAWGRFDQVAHVTGMEAVAERCRVALVPFARGLKVPCPFPAIVRSFPVAAPAVEADVLIHVPKLKAHQQLGFTAAVKTIYGCLPGKRKAFWHFRRPHDPDFARLLVAYHATVAPDLQIVDAVLAHEGRGPRRGQPRFVGVIAAGTDAVAVDTVLAELIHAPPSHRFLLEAAREMGVGEPDLEKIEIRGEPLAERRVADFVFPDLVGVAFSLPRVVRSVLRQWWLSRRHKER